MASEYEVLHCHACGKQAVKLEDRIWFPTGHGRCTEHDLCEQCLNQNAGCPVCALVPVPENDRESFVTMKE